MAIENVTPSAEAPATTLLQPQEYLQWLLSLESASGLPKGTRAYLVSFDHTDTRRLTPVGDQDSVVNLRDLVKHLADSPQPTELLVGLRDFCNERLKERGEDALVALDADRQEVGRDANYELLLLAHILQREIIERDQSGVIAPIARGMLARLKTLSDVIYEAAFADEDERVEVSDLRRQMTGVEAVG